MKNAPLAFILVGALSGALDTAWAGTTNIYVEDWGTTNGGTSVQESYNPTTAQNPFALLGWSIIAPATQGSGGPPYEGIYGNSTAIDVNTGASLPANTVYYTFLAAGQTGMLYTTDTAGNGGNGDSAFSDINPAQYTNLTLSVEGNNTGTAASNYFAVQVGGAWYVSTNLLSSTSSAGDFAEASTPYTNLASAWNDLTINANTVTIGSTPSANLSGPITGVGIVQLGAGGWDYNEITISAFAAGGGGVTVVPASIIDAPINQTTYAGGGISFTVLAGGTQPITYIWETNGVPLTDGGRISGADTNTLTITNLNANDALVTYSVTVSNAGNVGANPPVTDSGFTVTVNPVPSDYLYAETVPFIGPGTANNLPTSTIGWASAIPDGPDRIYNNGGGSGAIYAYEATAMTTAFYTTITNDIGQSGLPFPTIDPADYPQVALEVNLDANSVVTDVTVYFAVQMNSSSWYVASTNIPENLATSGVFEDQQMQFTTSATAWNTLTITATGASIGGPAPGALTGNITGVGLVFVHHGAGGDFNWDQFLVTTDVVAPQAPTIGDSGVPWSQTVASGGGVSFGVSTTGGATPFTYGWTLNGVPLVDGTLPDGAIVSGAQTPTVTIAAVTTNESGPSGTVDVVAFVTNSAGFDESDNYFGPAGTTLTVTNPAIGLLYSESFPFVGPISGNYPVTDIGWTEAVSGTPASLYETIGGDGAVFAYQGGAATVAYYTTTETDTNQSGLPFPNINLAGYPNVSLSVSIAPSFNSANVTAYFVAQINSSAWYIAANPIPVPVGDTSTFSPYTMAFNPAKANWNNVTITASGALIGATAASNLSGVMTGAGLVFVFTGAGGTFNFEDFAITGSGLGDINLGALSAGSRSLSWVGNPSVNLQSATSLSSTNWQDVPKTLGLYSWPITLTATQKYFRLVDHP
jgi:hypothetical protein